MADRVLPIIRHMSQNENLLGLASLWDSEVANAEWDTRREEQRESRGSRYFRDAIVEVSHTTALTITTHAFDDRVHVRRIGLLWVDGFSCGSTERVIVAFSSIEMATAERRCECRCEPPTVYELVPFGAVLRELERQRLIVTVTTGRHGLQGRIDGVWRDSITVSTPRGAVVFPHTSIDRIVIASRT